MGIQIIVVSRLQSSLLYEYQLSSCAMLNLCIIKQEDFVMFLYITIFVLATLVCISDSLFQSLMLELIGELLTTILIPYNILQGEDSLSHYVVFFNRNIFNIFSNVFQSNSIFLKKHRKCLLSPKNAPNRYLQSKNRFSDFYKILRCVKKNYSIW